MTAPETKSTSKTKRHTRRSSRTAVLRVDWKLWIGPIPARLIVYALDVAHLALAPEPVVDYERTALFKEKAPESHWTVVTILSSYRARSTSFTISTRPITLS